MKTRSIFQALSPEDQQHILNLCASHTYAEVLEILPKPRPEGLQIKTSHSALCRFYCSHQADARRAAILQQAAESLQFIRQDGSSFRASILALMEMHLFDALRGGKKLTALKSEFAILKDFHKGFIAEERWRNTPGINSARELTTHRAATSRDSHYDFVPVDSLGQPTEIPPLSDEELKDLRSLEDTPDLAQLDHLIAAHGRLRGKKLAILQNFPVSLIDARIQAYEQDLRARGLTPLEAALQARRARLIPAVPPLPPNPSSGKNHSRNPPKTPVNPLNPPYPPQNNPPGNPPLL